jgi:Tol biopolymer transport system component
VRADLFLLDVEGGEIIPVIERLRLGLVGGVSPDWTDDGQRILFEADRNRGESHLFALEAGDRGPLLHDLGPGYIPTATPAGDRIVFNLGGGSVPGVPAGLWAMQADGSRRRRVGEPGRPSLSPDGRKILVSSLTRPVMMKLVDLESGVARPVHVPGYQTDSIPSWAGPTSVTSVVRAGGEESIALLDVSDPGNARVERNLWSSRRGPGVRPASPFYSPVTGRCVFIGRRDSGTALYAVPSGEIGPAERLGFQPDFANITSLTVSPDGRYVLFSGDRPGATP